MGRRRVHRPAERQLPRLPLISNFPWPGGTASTLIFAFTIPWTPVLVEYANEVNVRLFFQPAFSIVS